MPTVIAKKYGSDYACGAYYSWYTEDGKHLYTSSDKWFKKNSVYNLGEHIEPECSGNINIKVLSEKYTSNKKYIPNPIGDAAYSVEVELTYDNMS